MVDAVSQFRLPPALDLTDAALAETFRSWRRQVDFYLKASGPSEKPKATQTAIILQCAGVQVQEVYKHFVFADDADKDDPQKVLDKLEEYCSPRSNEVIETHRFWNMTYHEPLDTFLTGLRSRTNLANFGDMKGRMLRDKTVFSMTEKVQELLLREKTLDLQKAVDICRAHELTSKQTKEMAGAHIDKVTSSRHKSVGETGGSQHSQDKREESSPDKRGRQDFVQDCNCCGRSHERKKKSCPAWGKLCRKCNGRNHFQSKCREVHGVSVEVVEKESDMEPQFLSAVTSHSVWRVTALMRINECDVRFQLDSAADVNTICAKFVKKHQLLPSKQKLTVWNDSTMRPLGEQCWMSSTPRMNNQLLCTSLW